MKNRMILLLLGWCFIFTGSVGLSIAEGQSATVSWFDAAAELSNEDPAVRGQAEKTLQAIPHLEKVVSSALQGERRESALAVIRALQLKGLVPRLIAISQDSPSWNLIHTLNLLHDSENGSMIDQYLERALEKYRQLDATSIMAVLDGLREGQVAVRPSKLSEFLKHPSFEVRSSAADFICQAWKLGKQSAWSPLIHEALAQRPYQVRLEMLHCVLEAPKLAWAPFDKEFSRLLQDEQEEVRALAKKAKEGQNS